MFFTAKPSPRPGLGGQPALRPGGGGTGLTVTNSTYANVELMSKTKSIIYSIMFG